MKEIKLQYFENPDRSSHYKKDKCYRVFLDKGHTFRFTDKKDVSKFLNGVSNSLSMHMHEIMLLTADVQHHASCSWILFDKFNGSNFENITYGVAMISKMYERQFYVQNDVNGAQYAVSQLAKVANMLIDTMNDVIMLSKDRNLTLEIKKAEILNRRLLEIRNRIENVGEIVLEQMKKSDAT